jgi:hypothetical protein
MLIVVRQLFFYRLADAHTFVRDNTLWAATSRSLIAVTLRDRF